MRQPSNSRAGAVLAKTARGNTKERQLAGRRDEAERVREELREAMAPGALDLWAPGARSGVAELWRWRDGVSLAVAAQRGGKVSEDIVVPVDRLGDAIAGTLEIGRAHGLSACSWGHAGDGNLHSTFLVDASRADDVSRAHAAARDLHELAVGLGGSISGEHGIGWLKRTAWRFSWAHGRMTCTDRSRGSLTPRI